MRDPSLGCSEASWKLGEEVAARWSTKAPAAMVDEGSGGRGRRRFRRWWSTKAPAAVVHEGSGRGDTKEGRGLRRRWWSTKAPAAATTRKAEGSGWWRLGGEGRRRREEWSDRRRGRGWSDGGGAGRDRCGRLGFRKKRQHRLGLGIDEKEREKRVGTTRLFFTHPATVLAHGAIIFGSSVWLPPGEIRRQITCRSEPCADTLFIVI